MSTKIGEREGTMATGGTAAPSPNGPGARPGGSRPARKGGGWLRRNRGKLVMGAAAVLVALMALRALQPDPLAVDAARVTRGDLQVTVDEEGVTRVVEGYTVAAPVAGRLERIALDEGDEVPAGAVVARIAAPPLDARTEMQSGAAVSTAEAQLAQANARIAEARAALAQASREARRAETLARAGALSDAAREQAQLAETTRRQELAVARAAATAAAAQVRSARAGLADASAERAPGATVTLVRSPVAGRVLRVMEESERMVAPGTPLVSLGDARALEIVVDVLSTDAVRIEPGMPVRVEEWGGGEPLRARVRSVSPAAFTEVSALGVEEQRVHVHADLEDPPGRLGDGYRVEARIVTWQGRGVLKVPTSALFRTGERWSVFVIDAGRARLREIEVGRRGEAEAEVRSGLRPGETVVLYPSDKVKDGVHVVAR
ncbi:MAG TPA: efflux RND transporter periplasmic adaptor subunit [Longimicrobium sp.]|nr:efflux RND transporter periplasmic adaptor subunit [Longimicrobium sp.]